MTRYGTNTQRGGAAARCHNDIFLLNARSRLASDSGMGVGVSGLVAIGGVGGRTGIGATVGG